MFEFLKRFLGYSTQTEPVAPYKVEAPVVEATKCGCGRSPSGYCIGLHKLSDAAWAAKQAADAPQSIPAPAGPVVAAPVVRPPAKVKRVVKAKPAVITAKPKAAPVAPKVVSKPKTAPKATKPKAK